MEHGKRALKGVGETPSAEKKREIAWYSRGAKGVCVSVCFESDVRVMKRLK